MTSLYPTQPLADGRFQVLSLLRVGGTGSAWRAIVAATGENVAIKAIAAANGGAELAARERDLTVALAHPAVLQVRESFIEGEVACMVMDLARCSLADRVRALGPLTPEQAAAALLPALGALAEAHARGIVHRDVKPHNLLLFDDGSVRLADWGAARARLEGNGTTRTGALLGTVPFLAPEQRRDPRLAGPPADMYAAGVTLAWLVLGEAPDDPAIPATHAHLRARLPLPLAELVIAACAFAPDARPGVATLAEALAAWLADQPPGAGRLVVPDDEAVADDLATAVERARLRTPAGPTRGMPGTSPRETRSTWALGLAGTALTLVLVTPWLRETTTPARETDPQASTAPPGEALRRGAGPPPSQDPDAGVSYGGRLYPWCADALEDFTGRVELAPRETMAASIEDLDADGRLDVLFTNQLEETASIWWGREGGMPTSGAQVRIGQSQAPVSVVDLDGDGVRDLVASLQDDSAFGVVRGLGDRRFGDLSRVMQGPAPHAGRVVSITAGLFAFFTGDEAFQVRRVTGVRDWPRHQGILHPSALAQGLVVQHDGAPWLVVSNDRVDATKVLPDGTLGEVRTLSELPNLLLYTAKSVSGDGEYVVTFLGNRLLARLDWSGQACALYDRWKLGQLGALADLDGDGVLDATLFGTCAGCTSNQGIWKGRLRGKGGG